MIVALVLGVSTHPNPPSKGREQASSSEHCFPNEGRLGWVTACKEKFAEIKEQYLAY